MQKLGGLIDPKCEGCKRIVEIELEPAPEATSIETESRCPVYAEPGARWVNHGPDRKVPVGRAGCPFHPSCKPKDNGPTTARKRVGQQKQNKRR